MGRVERLPLPEHISGHDRNKLQVVREGLELLDPRNETYAERTARLRGKRLPYASMRAHQELAALVLASGGTFRLAAAKAGVSVRQVKKYYTDTEFRHRIEELRQTLFGKIRGRVLKELEVRTRNGTITKIDLLDLLRIFDRVYGAPNKGGAGAAINVQGDVNVGDNYDTIIQALLAPLAGEESADFPIYEHQSPQLSSGDPSE